MEKIDLSSEPPIQACSTSPKSTKVEQISPTLVDEWPNRQSSTMITPPPTTTTSSCETMNCSCCDYDGHYYHSSSSSSSSSTSTGPGTTYQSQYYPPTHSSQATPSTQQMTVNVPVVANFQVNVNTHHGGYPLTNSNNTNHLQHQQQNYHLSRKQSMYFQQASPSSYYRTGYSPTMKYNPQQASNLMYHPPAPVPPTPMSVYSSSSQPYLENQHQHQHQPHTQPPQQAPSHFPISSSYSQDYVYGPRQHHSMSYNTLHHNNHPTNGHVYHQL